MISPSLILGALAGLSGSEMRRDFLPIAVTLAAAGGVLIRPNRLTYSPAVLQAFPEKTMEHNRFGKAEIQNPTQIQAAKAAERVGVLAANPLEIQRECRRAGEHYPINEIHRHKCAATATAVQVVVGRELFNAASVERVQLSDAAQLNQILETYASERPLEAARFKVFHSYVDHYSLLYQLGAASREGLMTLAELQQEVIDPFHSCLSTRVWTDEQTEAWIV